MSTGADYRFDLDLLKGQVAEDLVEALLCGEMTVEVKRDYKVSQTGNVAIEGRYRGRNSGIVASTADWWAFTLSGDRYDDNGGMPEVVVLIKRERLWRILRAARVAGRLRIVAAGDDHAAKTALLPVADLLMPLGD